MTAFEKVSFYRPSNAESPQIIMLEMCVDIFQVKITRRIIYVVIAFCVSFGALFQIPWNFGPSDIIDGVCYPIGLWPSEITKQLVGLYIFIVEYLFPVSVMTFCYGRIYFVLQNKVIGSPVFYLKICSNEFVAQGMNETMKRGNLSG
jgi:hypothetical protein